jgi:hypothetical protein
MGGTEQLAAKRKVALRKQNIVAEDGDRIGRVDGDDLNAPLRKKDG